MPTSAQIRQQFIDFFVQKHGHTFVPSSPVVPLDDPTLLFTNAGMNQFKPIFLGQEKRAYTRAANTQKCIRAGGKHNDLDDVGRSRRHGTFFEMLGNWSFGDYFKQGAIEMAWELMTRVWKLDPARLHVTCFEGDEKNGVPRDSEAANIWKQVAGLPEDHIHYFGADNFWEMGETGPCGPCTEIYIDRRPQSEIDADRAAGRRAPVNADDPRVMEFWNNVFIQYNRNADRSLTTLPAQHVDTGMGFERICSILQDRDDMYGIDLFDPFFAAISDLCGFKYSGKFPRTNAPDPAAEAADEQLRHDIAFRVIADHMRTLTFAITDGAIPDKTGRNYVLRRILRRAVFFGRQHLLLADPFLYKLVPVVVDAMGAVFSELERHAERVVEIIHSEEVAFGKTIDRGIDLFHEIIVGAYIAHNGGTIDYTRQAGIQIEESKAKHLAASEEFTHISGSSRKRMNWSQAVSELKALGRNLEVVDAEDAFKLHDTYGFPIDLTRIMAAECGMSIDEAGYQKRMEEARKISKAGAKSEDSRLTQIPPEALAQVSQTGVKPTDDRAKYSHAPISAHIMAIWNGDDLGLSPASAFEDEELSIILDQTNFYAEMGGQVGDSGELRSGQNIFDVATTKLVGSYVLHVGRLRSGKLRVGDIVQAVVSPSRLSTEKNHTGTHLANWALRETLGDAVQQKGSLVDPEKLRFDFSHGKAMTDDEIAKVQTLVNQGIAKNLPLYAEEAPQDKALKINGLRAVFGEKYPSMVRVVSLGAPVKDLLSDPANPKWRQFSIEFCGGTHLANSKEIEKFAITAEESVSKGIRRIVAVTGPAAASVESADQQLDELIARGRSASDDHLASSIAAIQKSAGGAISLRAKRKAHAAVAELQTKQKALEKASRKTGSDVDAVKIAADLLAQAPALAGGKLIVGDISGASDDQLRSAVDSLRKKSPSHAILVAASSDGKVTFVAAVSDDLISKGLKAGDWIKHTATVTGGGGGGRPQMAQGSGKDPAKLNDALVAAREFARRIS